MLLYRDIVNRVLDREVQPLFQQLLDQAMTVQYGDHWYDAVGRKVLSKIRDFHRIDERIQGDSLHAAENMDLTSIFFLLYPYEENNGSVSYLEGFLDVFASYTGLQEWQKRKLSRVRIIRNNVAHDRADKDDPTDQKTLLNGELERKWIQELENILCFFNPQISLSSYQERLNDDVQEMKKKQTVALGTRATYVPPVRNLYALRTEELRQDVKYVYRMDFMEGRIQEPMRTIAPWTQGCADLRDMPWPSKVLAEQQAQPVNRNASPVKRSTPPMQNNTTSSQDVVKEVTQMFEETTSILEKGINSLFGSLFGNKK